jgi:hypothetical protein
MLGRRLEETHTYRLSESTCGFTASKFTSYILNSLQGRMGANKRKASYN